MQKALTLFDSICNSRWFTALRISQTSSPPLAFNSLPVAVSVPVLDSPVSPTPSLTEGDQDQELKDIISALYNTQDLTEQHPACAIAHVHITDLYPDLATISLSPQHPRPLQFQLLHLSIRHAHRLYFPNEPLACSLLQTALYLLHRLCLLLSRRRSHHLHHRVRR